MEVGEIVWWSGGSFRVGVVVRREVMGCRVEDIEVI